MKPSNASMVLEVCGVTYHGAGYSCVCGCVSRTRGEARKHRKGCSHTAEAFARRMRVQRRDQVRGIR